MSLFGGIGGMFGGGWNNPNFGPMPLNRNKNPWWRQLGQWGNNPFGNYSQQRMNQTGGMGGNTLDPNGVGGPGPFGGGGMGGGVGGGMGDGGFAAPNAGSGGGMGVGDEWAPQKPMRIYGGPPSNRAEPVRDFHGGLPGNPLDDIWAQRAALQREQQWQASQGGPTGGLNPVEERRRQLEEERQRHAFQYQQQNPQQIIQEVVQQGPGYGPSNDPYNVQVNNEFPGFDKDEITDMIELIKNQYKPSPYEPGSYEPVNVEQVESDADPMAVIRSTLPAIRHAQQVGNAQAAARLGAGGMGASSAYASALGDSAARASQQISGLYHDVLGKHAENQAQRDQQRRMQEAQFRQQGQLFDRDEAFNSWRSFEDISQRGAGGLMQLLRMFGGG